MRLDHDSDELSPGRLFRHRRLNDPMTGGPLYPRRLPIGGFIEEIFGGWYEGSWPPPAPRQAPRGQPVPLDPWKIRSRPGGS